MTNVICQQNLQETIHQFFPDLEIERGWDEDPYIGGVCGPTINKISLSLPQDDEFNCSVVAVEENSSIGRSATLLLESWFSRGDRKIRRKCWLLGEEEETLLPCKYFWHELPGNRDRFPDFDSIRHWCWKLRGNQSLALIHGPWGFISARPRGDKIADKKLHYDGAIIEAEVIRQDGDRHFLLNPESFSTGKLNIASLEGWYELRQGRLWQEPYDD